MLTYLTILQAVLCAAVTVSAKQPSAPMDAYDIVYQAAIPVLPAPLQDFLANESADTNHADSTNINADSHFVMLDIAAESDDVAALRKAAEDFPLPERTARRLFRQHAKGHRGRLPWALVDAVDTLERLVEGGRHAHDEVDLPPAQGGYGRRLIAEEDQLEACHARLAR